MSPKEALELARGLAGANRFRVIGHAIGSMRKRGAGFPDVQHGLMSARSATLQPNGRWKLESVDTDGDGLTLIIEFQGDVIVVTLF